MSNGASGKDRSRALDILIYLAERPGQVIGKKELIDNVWPDVQPMPDGRRLGALCSVKRAGGAGMGAVRPWRCYGRHRTCHLGGALVRRTVAARGTQGLVRTGPCRPVRGGSTNSFNRDRWIEGSFPGPRKQDGPKAFLTSRGYEAPVMVEMSCRAMRSGGLCAIASAVSVECGRASAATGCAANPIKDIRKVKEFHHVSHVTTGNWSRCPAGASRKDQ